MLFHLNLFPYKPWFLCVCNKNLMKTLWEKEKLFIMSNFSFTQCVFYPSGELSDISIKFEIVICKLFRFGRVLNFVVWERVIVEISLIVQHFKSSIGTSQYSVLLFFSSGYIVSCLVQWLKVLQSGVNVSMPSYRKIGLYCFTIVRLSVRLSVCLHKLNMKT